MKEYIYQLLDRLSDQYKTEYKRANLEAEVKEKVELLTIARDHKAKKHS